MFVFTTMKLKEVIMMITLAIALTVVAVAVELMLVARLPWAVQAMRRRPVLAAVLSLTLSWVIGQAFGAAGMVVMLAALGSTVITAVVYATGVIAGARALRALFVRQR